MDLSFMEKDDLIKEFQDLIDHDTCGRAAIEVAQVDVDSIEVHKLDAKGLSPSDVISELERRGVQPKGFYAVCRLALHQN